MFKNDMINYSLLMKPSPLAWTNLSSSILSKDLEAEMRGRILLQQSSAIRVLILKSLHEIFLFILNRLLRVYGKITDLSQRIGKFSFTMNGQKS